MKSTTPAKPAPKPRATKKSVAVEGEITAAVNADAPVYVKLALGSCRPVMALPPPTGQPVKPAGKAARIPDTPTVRHGTMGKREVAPSA